MDSRNASFPVARLVDLGRQSVSENLLTAYFDVHGISTRLTTDSEIVIRAISGLLEAFVAQETSAPDIDFFLFTVNELKEDMVPVPGDASMLYDWNIVKVYNNGSDRYLTVDQKARVAADIKENVAAGFVGKDYLDSDWIVSHYVFYPLWAQMLKERGLFPLHAAGLVRNGRSILLPGRSGSGKSTLSLQLVQDGFGLLSDDTVFLRSNGDKIDAFSFPEEININEQTIELIPELSNVKNFTKNELRQKSSFQIDELHPDSFVDSAVPGLILFPKIADSDKTCVEPMSRTEALTLAMRYAFFFLDPSTTAKHFEILSMLVKQAPCYHLLTGSDRNNMLQVINGLFEDPGSAHNLSDRELG